jgi:DNA-binding beta-propeller fold protein YncE
MVIPVTADVPHNVVLSISTMSVQALPVVVRVNQKVWVSSVRMGCFNEDYHMKTLRLLQRAAGTAILCTLLAGARIGAGSGKDIPRSAQPSTDISELIWPLPPDPPRVRWLAQYTDMARVKTPVVKKPGWLDKVTGTKAPGERSLELRKPYGITTDSRGRIYAADTELQVVFVIDPVARVVERRAGSSRAPLVMPVGVATDAENRLFVSDAQLHSITCFTSGGEVVARFGAAALGRPGGIAIDRQRNRLYAADAKENRIAVFDLNKLDFLRYFGKPSTDEDQEPGSFAGPTNVAVDRQGNIYIADTFNCRVQVLNPEGKVLRAFGTAGNGPGTFIRPKGIAVDSEGHVYVADAEFNNFQVFSPEGQILLAVGTLGTAPGEFGLIAGLHIDSADRIYTTEMYIGRIQVFQYIVPPASGDKKGGA